MSDARCPFHEFFDPFAAARKEAGHHVIEDHDERVTMVLGHGEVRRVAGQPETYSSQTTPGRIVVPSEEDIRTLRQIPVEVDPPAHADYRALLDPWFRRPYAADYQAALTELVERAVDEALAAETVEVVHDFALPLQSRALTLLLNCPLAEADRWIGWGTHVFRSDTDPLNAGKANQLDDYLRAEIERAAADPATGTDLYAELLRAEYRGRALTREEIAGIMQLTFAGGRDTVINAVANAVAHFAAHPEQLAGLLTSPAALPRAVEELVRYFSPLTHLGRVTATATTAGGAELATDERLSLCWAAANRDETVFDEPNEVRLDRKANPHVGFGFGIHQCLGAAHARQLLKVLLRTLAQRRVRVTVVDHTDNVEVWGGLERKVGFERLVSRWTTAV